MSSLQSRYTFILEQMLNETPAPSLGTKCAICLEEPPRNPVMLFCNHFFCQEDILDNWLMTGQNNTCPSCRTIMFRKPPPPFECGEIVYPGGIEAYWQHFWARPHLYFPLAATTLNPVFFHFDIPLSAADQQDWFANTKHDICLAAEYSVSVKQAHLYVELNLSPPDLAVPLIAMGNFLAPLIQMDRSDAEQQAYMFRW